MTTTVKVQPAGHHVRVTVSHRNEAQPSVAPSSVSKTYMKPGDPERAFHAHSAASVLVEEISGDVYETEFGSTPQAKLPADAAPEPQMT